MSSTDVAHKLHSKPRTDDVVINENVDFTGLMLGDAVLRGLEKSGFKRPSPIQLKAIPLGRCGLDLIVQAKSGTGKTCVFSVCCLDSIVVDGNSLQVLVLAPTREIAVQIWEVMNGIGAAFDGLCCYCFIGGMPVSEDQLKLRKCHIAVGTPGRIKQLIQEGCMVTDNIRMFVLDEADKLLEDNFQESVNWIYSTLPENKQMLALSATYPESLAQHLTSYMRNPTFIRLNSDDPTLLGIRHYYKKVGFHPLAQKAFDYKVKELIKAQSLSDILNASGWPSTYISGSQDQQHRFTAMAKLKKYKCRVLISTDLTSRGIDAENVNLVVNLDIPKDHETYLHRIGRAGRFGTYGAGISLAAEGEELDRLYNIQQKCNKSIKVLPDPIPSDLAHSSGYVNIENLVITEQIITDTDTKSPKADKHPDEIVVSSTNHTDVNSKTSSNISDQNSAEGNIMNNDNKTKTDIESKEKQMSEEYSQVDGNKTEILKRKILKSGRKKIDEKKNPWSEWLATSEDSINKENANRESTRGAVAYDVDMFGNGTEKVKHNQVSKSESNAASKSNIFVDDKDSVGKSTQSNTTALKLANTAESPSKFDCTERELVTYDDFDIFGSSSKKDKKKKKKKNKDVENKEVESAAVNENELAGSGDTAVTETNSESMDLLKGGSDDHIVAKPKQLWSKKYKDEKDPNKMSYEELLSSYVHHKKNVSKDDQLNQNVKKQLDVEDVLTDITQKLQNTLISEECSENKNAYTFEESKEDFENFMKLDPSEQEQELQKALDGRCVGKKGSFEDETFENIEKLLSIQKSQQEQLFHTGKILKEVNGVQKQESNATDVNVKEDKDNFVGENSQEQAKPQKPLFMGMTGSRVPAPDTNRQPVFLKTAVESSTYYSKHNNDVKSEICDIDEQLQNLSLRPPEDQSLGQEYMKLLGAKPEKEDGEISQEEGEINGSFSEDEVTKTKVSEPENVYRGRAFNNWVPVESPRHEYGEELLDYAYHNDSTYDIEHEDSRKEDHYYHPENNEPAYYKSRKDNRKKDKQCGYEGKYDHDNIDYEYDPDNKEYEQYQEYEYNQDKGYYHHSNNDLSKTAKHYYEAQQYMCAAQMNHMYWMNLSQSAQSFSSQYWQQMATWHSQCSRYYKDLYKKEQLKEELYKEYQSKKEYISGMSSSKSN